MFNPIYFLKNIAYYNYLPIFKIYIFSFHTEIYYNIKETFSQSNPIREHVDVTKPNPKYIKPYIENEVHPNPSVRVSQLFV